VAFVPSGGEFRVNSQTSGDQLTPAIGALSDGGFVVVWDDASDTLGDSDGRSIKAQRYDALANAVGGEFLVNTQTAGNQFQQRVTGLTDGRFVITWADFSGIGDGSFSSVQAQIFSATGTRIGTEFLVNTETVSSQFAFDVAALTNGGFVITWDHDGRAKAQVYDANGARVGGEIVADAAPGHSSTPRAAGLPTGGFVVTWTFDNSTILDVTDDSIKSQLYGANGGRIGTEITVAAARADMSTPDVASLFGGNFVVTWTDPGSTSGDIRAQIFDRSGNTIGSEILVNTTTTDMQISPSIAAVSGGGFVITWTDFSAGSTNTDIRAQLFGAAGAKIGSEFLVNTQASLNQDFPAVVGLPGDGFVTVWADQSGTLGDNSGSSVKAQAYQDDATGVNEPPVNTVPGTLSAGHDPLTIQVSFDDDDVPPGNFIFPGYLGAQTLTLTAVHGTLTGSIQKFFRDVATVEGSGTHTVKFTANPEILNGGIFIQYQADPAFFGADTVTMTVNDAGETGSGGPKSDTDSFTINVGPLFTGTPGDDNFTVSQGLHYEGYFGGAGSDTLYFPFSLSATSVRYEDNGLIVEHAPTLTKALLVDIETVVFPDGTVHQDDGSPLVDDLYYYAHNLDVWAAHVDADQHFNTSGWQEQRDPNAFFSTRLYLATNPDVAAAGVNALTHFDTNGWREGRIPSVLFDPAQYLAAYPDVAAANVDPLAHFLQFGLDEGRKAFAPTRPIVVGDFDYRYYLTKYQDVAASGVDPFQHFQQFGWKEGRNPNALFDTKGYLATYSDVAASGTNPLDHYNHFGWHEGRDPSVNFDTTSYLAAYPDVAAAEVNPLAHYLQFGLAEGRQAFADGVWG
jgi:hypothetical protein